MESKIRQVRVKGFFYYLYSGYVGFLSPSSLFLSPHQSSHPPFLLKFFPSSTMSTPNDTILLSTHNYQYEEVWGMDNHDFYDGSDELVCVVKCSGIYPRT